MNTTNKNELYVSYLEALNKAQDIETLYNDAFEIIFKIFNPSRVQIWEKISNTSEMSIFYEYFKDNETSMLKFRIKPPEESLKKSFEKTNIWEYLIIKDETILRHNIKSLLGVEFSLPGQNKGLLVLTSKEENKKYSSAEIGLLIKMKKQLEDATFKIEKYQKSFDDFRKLQNQNNHLREQDRLRTNFINNITHELKTPLASIIGFSKILTSKNLDTKTSKEISDQIYFAANRLSSLVTDFLQINKIDTEGWLARIEACDIGEIIKKSIEEFISLNKECKISCLISDNYPIIKTDPKLIRQVLDNLISNAIKYSPKGGNITVSLQATPYEKELKISVSDQGIGIDKEEIKKIFNRFYRSTNPEVQKTSGSGLGLAICKEIITSLNGHIYAESESQKGSKFTFTLPIN